jgi:hypothetical protein
VFQIIRDYRGRMRLQSSGDYVGVVWIRQVSAHTQELVEVEYHRLFESLLHARSLFCRLPRWVDDALFFEDAGNCSLSFIKHFFRPAEAKKLRLRQSQQEVPLESANERAGVGECRVAICKQGLENLRVRFG